MLRLCAGRGARIALRCVRGHLRRLTAASSTLAAMSGIGPSGVALYVDGSCKFNQRVGEVTRDAGWGVVCLSVEDREYGEEIGGPVVQRHLRPLPGGELWGPVVLDASSALHLHSRKGILQLNLCKTGRPTSSSRKRYRRQQLAHRLPAAEGPA